jgi:hypothetical protein
VIYISGPMTGIPEFNFPAFNAAAERLRAEGHAVVNPAELDVQDAGKAMEWADYLRRDIKALMDCKAIALLPGWDKSRGATLEHYIATKLGMRVIDLTEAQADSCVQLKG